MEMHLPTIIFGGYWQISLNEIAILFTEKEVRDIVEYKPKIENGRYSMTYGRIGATFSEAEWQKFQDAARSALANIE